MDRVETDTKLHNDRVIMLAQRQLSETMKHAIASGVAGAYGIRVPFNRGRFGKPKEMLERESKFD